MPVEIKVPAVGESVTEAVLARWLKKDGDAVRRDEPVAELESDKATVELEFLKSRSLSVVAALVVAAAISFFAPAKWNQRLWPGWVCVVPIGALAVLAYYLTPYFTR